jgi:DNA-binding SARP family transcriptional activator
VRYRLLGPLEVVGSDGRIVPIRSGKQRALLALLLLNANRVVSADRLIDDLWDEDPPATAAKSVQVHVSQLRKALRAEHASSNGHVVVTQGHGYVLHAEPGDLDVIQFERALADAQRHLSRDDHARAEVRARKALALWRGPALADFTYESFAQSEIARLDELRLAALETSVEARLGLGEHARLVSELEVLVADHPLQERFCGQLMLALYRCGRQAEALAAYRRAERTFRDELGLEPTPALRRLEQRILAQDPDLAPAPPPPKAPRAAPAPAGRATSGRRALPLPGPLLVSAAALLLVSAAGLALLQRDEESPVSGPVLDAAANTLVAVDPGALEPELTIPLPGRPTDIAAAGDSGVWIPTVDSAALTGVSARRRAISRTVPLRGAPDSVALGEGSIWVSDGSRGVLSRIRPGYESVSQRIRFPRTASAPPHAGRLRVPRSSLAVGEGSVWVTNGSPTLTRVDPSTGRSAPIAAGRKLGDVAVAGGAVWAISARPPTVLRIEPRDGSVTSIPIAGRAGGDSPFPIGIAATEQAIWVLNGNTATVTRIDPRTRGVVTTVALGVERVPNDIAAEGGVAWVANSDGTLSRLDAGSSRAESISVGESLEEVTTDGSRVWATTTALDQRLPGGGR